ncbi:MAG: SDR family NAD(P)-dependent oxidoreductase [Candidatus Heimdallarchaeota archaeon]|nr:SDR family NAD(P)-dependent oxidoreductase [Candidatus Heimdallarchaeota archaeon]
MRRKKGYKKHSFFEDGKVVLITGASSGIGKNVALALANYGTKLVIVARREKKLIQTTRQLRKLKIKVLPIIGDIRTRDDRARIVEQTMKNFGRIDVLINNAGLGKANLFLEQPISEIDELIETNVLGLIKMSKLVIPIMKEQNNGHIINLSSSLALLQVYPFAVYCATKSAVKTFSDCIRDEVKAYGIKISTVFPGPYGTEFHKVAGLDDSSYQSYSVSRLAEKIARLVIKPKDNLIQPWFFIPLIWITTRFRFIKRKITSPISSSIMEGKIKKGKLESMKKEEKLKITVKTP